MFKVLVFITIVLCVNVINATSKYPSDLPKCKYGDTKCIVEAINKIASMSKNGLPSLNIENISPIKINKIKLIQGSGDSSAVSMTMNFKNVLINGVADSIVSSVVGFGKDIKASTFEINLNVPFWIMKGDYVMKGKMLVLPIEGNGQCNLTLTNARTIVKFDTEAITKDGEEYLHVKKMHVSFEPEDASVYFSNLFNGDKMLGDNMNTFMNENWRDIFKEMKKVLFKSFGKIYERLINNVFAKFPYKDFFIDG